MECIEHSCVWEGTLSNNLLMKSVPVTDCLLKHFYIPIVYVAFPSLDIHDHVMVSESQDVRRCARKPLKVVFRMNIENKHAIASEVLFNRTEGPDPVPKSWKVIDRIVWADNCVELTGQIESHHALSMEIDIGQFQSCALKHRS